MRANSTCSVLPRRQLSSGLQQAFLRVPNLGYRRRRWCGQRLASLRPQGSFGADDTGPTGILLSMSDVQLTFLPVDSSLPDRMIAVRARDGKSPGLFWLGGFKSDMKGTKAEALDCWAEKEGRACLRFDYSGHGESGGIFTDGTIGRWLGESLAVYLRFAQGPQVVIGSSMGGWLALLLARALSRRSDAAPIAGMVLIAPAVDFTEELMWKQFPDATKREFEQNGCWMR